MQQHRPWQPRSARAAEPGAVSLIATSYKCMSALRSRAARGAHCYGSYSAMLCGNDNQAAAPAAQRSSGMCMRRTHSGHACSACSYVAAHVAAASIDAAYMCMHAPVSAACQRACALWRRCVFVPLVLFVIVIVTSSSRCSQFYTKITIIVILHKNYFSAFPDVSLTMVKNYGNALTSPEENVSYSFC